MKHVFRLRRIDISPINRNNPSILRVRIEQRYNILFGLFHYWSTPSFAPPHLFVTKRDAIYRLRNMFPKGFKIQEAKS